MRIDHLSYHLNRRQLLARIGTVGAAGALATGAGASLLSSVAGASEPGHDHDNEWLPDGSTLARTDYDDTFSIEGALNGSWAAATSARYGANDQLGSLNEITPRKTAQALRLLDNCREVVTYRLGHLMVNGIPGFVTFPPRKYSQRLTVLGYTPSNLDTEWFSTTTRGNAGEDEWRVADRARGPLGYFQGPTGFGTNELSAHEERLLEGGTYQIATQLDNLNHVGVRNVFYNGHNASDFATPTGTSQLGMESVPPFATRGVILDILELKISQGASSDLQTVNGHQMLTDSYRITLGDIQDAMRRHNIKGLSPGDVVCFRTGWHWLADDPTTHEKYLATEPGIYLREARWLVDHRPAVIASDTWALEVLPGQPVSDPGQLFVVHQELIVRPPATSPRWAWPRSHNQHRRTAVTNLKSVGELHLHELTDGFSSPGVAH
jgi:hypothetical protein